MKSIYSHKILNIIEQLPSGSVVTLDTFPVNWSRNSVARVLSRLESQGIITRIKRGVYSKAKETRFGPVTPSPLEVLSKEVQQDDNKCFGGKFLFNNLGLTTQVPSVIEILNNKSSYLSKIGKTKVRYVRIRPLISKTTKRYIIILEVLKNSTMIPDSSVEKTKEWVIQKLKSMDNKETSKLAKIAYDYPPRVRALLGNIFQSLNQNLIAEKLKKTLNENSTYKVGLITELLENTPEWRLKK